ncbi:hypothetical protein BU17DRAFT_61208 [Hysterangium stoloniferum]|nr:hypothetical protein BU17DRAFT_61208 [Hysterangium stoloniferum]
MIPLGFIKRPTFRIFMDIVVVLFVVFVGHWAVRVLAPTFTVSQAPALVVESFLVFTDMVSSTLAYIISGIPHIPRYTFSFLLRHSAAAVQVRALDKMTKLAIFLKGQLPLIDTGVESRLFSATVTRIKLHFNLNLDLGEASKLLHSLPKHTLFRSLHAICYSDVLYPLATERLSAMVVLNDYMGERGELVAHLPPMLAAHVKETFCPKLRSRHVAAFRTLVVYTCLLLLIVLVVAVILLSWLQRLFFKRTTSIVRIDSDARHLHSRAIGFKHDERADREERRDSMEAQGAITEGATPAPPPNPQPHPSSIASPTLPASPAPKIACASSSGLFASVPTPPPSFSRMDVENKDPDTLARDSIIHDGVQSRVQAATGRAPAADEVNDSGEPGSVGHSDAKNREVEETEGIDGTKQDAGIQDNVRMDGGVLEQQDIPLPTLPQRCIMVSSKARTASDSVRAIPSGSSNSASRGIKHTEDIDIDGYKNADNVVIADHMFLESIGSPEANSTPKRRLNRQRAQSNGTNSAPTKENGREFSHNNNPATPQRVLLNMGTQTDSPTSAPSPSAFGEPLIVNILDFMERAVPAQSQPPSDKDLQATAFGTPNTIPEMLLAVPRIPDVPCEVVSSFASADTLVNIEDESLKEGSKSVPVGITGHERPTTGDDKEKDKSFDGDLPSPWTPQYLDEDELDGILRYTGRTVYRVVALPPIFTWGEGSTWDDHAAIATEIFNILVGSEYVNKIPDICQSLMDMSLGLQYSPQIATRPQLHLSLEQISAIKVWRERQPRPYILVLPPLPGDFIFSEESGIKQPEFQFKTITDEFGEVITTRMGSKYLPAVAERFHAAWRKTDDRITPKQVTSEAGSFIPESPESAIDLMDNCNISLDSARDPSEAMGVLAGNSVAPTTREASLSVVERKQEQESFEMLPEVVLKPAHTEEKVIVIEDVVPAANVFINCSVNCVGSSLTSEVNLAASKETEEQREVDIPQNVVLEQAEGVDLLKNNYAPVPAKEGSMTDSFAGAAVASTVSASPTVGDTNIGPEFGGDDESVALRTLPGAMNEFMDIIGRNVVAQNPPSEPSLSVVEQTEEKQSRGMPPESYDPTLEYTAAYSQYLIDSVQNMWEMVNISMNRSGDSVGPGLQTGRDTEDQQGAEISPSAVLGPAETEEIPEEGEKAEEQSGVDEPVSEHAAAEPATSDGKKKKKKKKKKKAAVSDGGPAMDIPDNGEPQPLAQAVVAPPPSPPPLAPERSRDETSPIQTQRKILPLPMRRKADIVIFEDTLGVKSKGQMHGMFAKGITAPSEIVHTGCCRLLLQARGSRRQRFALFTKQHVVKVGEIHHLKLCIGLASETYLAFFGQVNSEATRVPTSLHLISSDDIDSLKRYNSTASDQIICHPVLIPLWFPDAALWDLLRIPQRTDKDRPIPLIFSILRYSVWSGYE